MWSRSASPAAASPLPAAGARRASAPARTTPRRRASPSAPARTSRPTPTAPSSPSTPRPAARRRSTRPWTNWAPPPAAPTAAPSPACCRAPSSTTAGPMRPVPSRCWPRAAELPATRARCRRAIVPSPFPLAPPAAHSPSRPTMKTATACCSAQAITKRRSRAAKRRCSTSAPCSTWARLGITSTCPRRRPSVPPRSGTTRTTWTASAPTRCCS